MVLRLKTRESRSLPGLPSSETLPKLQKLEVNQPRKRASAPRGSPLPMITNEHRLGLSPGGVFVCTVFQPSLGALNKSTALGDQAFPQPGTIAARSFAGWTES